MCPSAQWCNFGLIEEKLLNSGAEKCVTLIYLGFRSSSFTLCGVFLKLFNFRAWESALDQITMSFFSGTSLPSKSRFLCAANLFFLNSDFFQKLFWNLCFSTLKLWAKLVHESHKKISVFLEAWKTIFLTKIVSVKTIFLENQKSNWPILRIIYVFIIELFGFPLLWNNFSVQTISWRIRNQIQLHWKSVNNRKIWVREKLK